MKFIILFAALFAVALAAPAPDAEILRQDSNVQPDGYNFGLELTDGTKKDEQGSLKNVGTEQEGIEVRGSYSWVDEKTGQTYTVNYIANENGYQPQGAHLPQ
ncbi:larval cuticle protein 65Ab1-like [Scaptodrosophila lebanonensis]|uniref:Larval cuticle protein 65Ab1-like n=1 Tax=Drosophila lebanonensis TaxID=7225 RepID=A0A6J2UCK5_DROLE|nr:larval cuticle protein 65Ab1-like [Scaptodrosophila lebanonensis]